MSNRRVRVRFAPSPTGPLHMGGVRTALYNYLFAKKHGGDFVLRIEDTDQSRFVPSAEEYIVESLNWSGISPDESPQNPGEYGPYRQSERKAMYREYADQLITSGHAYYAFDTAEELDQMRELAKQSGTANWQYNHVTRGRMKNSLSLSEGEVKDRMDAGEPYVIRIKLPRNEEVKFEDIVRGWVSVNTNNMDDKVLFKSDGMPTYHLANIVDDHLMQISHVIRGEEWLPSAPLHILLYRYLGWEESRPEFAHLPLLLKPDGNGKLSKRDGDRLGFPVFPLEWKDPQSGNIASGYREQGYFPEAFINMLAFLGWNPGTEQEIFSLEELCEAFTLERVNKAGARYDHDKTRWFNQQYLRMLPDEELARLLQPLLEEEGLESSMEKTTAVCHLMKERAYFVADMARDGRYFYAKPTEYNEKTLRKKWNEESKAHLGSLLEVFRGIDSWNTQSIEASFSKYLSDHELGFGKLGPSWRLAVTGAAMGPSMFEICAILGKSETIERIEDALSKLP